MSEIHNNISALGALIKRGQRVLLFRGQKSFDSFADYVFPWLNQAEIVQYSDFSTNPKADEVEQAFIQLEKEDYDLIVAIGGGSVLDFAKLFRFRYCTGISLADYFDKRGYSWQKQLPLIAVPTTAGTGAEATSFAVVYFDQEKKSLETQELLPEVAIIDYHFLLSQPKYLKAVTALDAFCQALEAYWSVNSTAASREYAARSIVLCRKYLSRYVNEGNEESCMSMAEASHLSGKAINIAKTTLSHALSYYITSHYNLPHGHAVALSISGLFQANLRVNQDNIQVGEDAESVRTRMGELLKLLEINAEQIPEYFNQLFAEIGIEYHLSKLNISNLYEVIHAVNPVRMKNNPLKLSQSEMAQLFIR